MTDETKHIVAKEVFFFSKWIVIDIVIAIIIMIIIRVMNNGYYWRYNFLEEVFLPIFFSSSFFTILPAYIYRVYKWVMKWK